MKHLTTIFVLFALTVPVFAGEVPESLKKDGWYSIFDGKTLDGWKANEKYDGWKVENGCIVGFGERNHLYFIKEEFRNFEFRMDIRVNSGGNSGVYVKSQWEEGAWPTTGFELQVNTTHPTMRTGSLYDCVRYMKTLHDDEWFTYHAICKGDAIEVRVNDEMLYIYLDRKDALPPGTPITAANKRIAQNGYLVLQQHDPKGVPQFRNIFVRKLPD